MIKDQGIFTLVIILVILITIPLDSVWISLGENWCWSLMGLKGFSNHDGDGNGSLKGFNNQNNNSAQQITPFVYIYWPSLHVLAYVHNVYRMAFALPRKSYRIGLLFTHKNCCGGETSVTGRSGAAPISNRFFAILVQCEHLFGPSQK